MSTSKYAPLPWISSQLCLGSHLDPASNLEKVVLFPAFPHPDLPRSTPCDDPGEVAGTGRGP